MATCRVIAKNLFIKGASGVTGLKQAEIGQVLEFTAGKMPPVWKGRVEVLPDEDASQDAPEAETKLEVASPHKRSGRK